MSALTVEPVNFAPYFTGREVRQTDDLALMDRVRQLRFQVYCQECHYLEASDYPDGRERDDCDAHSAHFVALNLQGDMAGYVNPLCRPRNMPEGMLAHAKRVSVDSEWNGTEQWVGANHRAAQNNAEASQHLAKPHVSGQARAES